MPLGVVFFGTPPFAERSLARIDASGHRLVGVVTQPDRPRGRGQKLVSGPVKSFAEARGLPVLQPTRLRDEAFMAAITAWRPDIAVVAAYGRILPQALIDLPRLGTINVHGSLLPRWRGAAPVHRAILAGDTETGVTIMRLVQALDAGPMLARTRVTIGPEETSAALEARLADAGAELLVATLDRLAEGPVPEEEQAAGEVTYAPRLERHESRVDWTRSAPEIHNQIRGLQPWPAAVVLFHGRRLTLLESAVVVPAAASGEPGTVVAVQPDGLIVATGAGALEVTRVQLEGRPAMAVRQFLNGHPVTAGDRFDALPIES
jgi:methionyl-tRNA formyltransferase